MNHVLIPVANEADARALPDVIRFLLPFKPRAVVVLNNPSVGITSATATAAADQKISELEKAKSDAVNREDFPAASQYKSQIEDAKMERADALRNGWKSVPESQRIAAYDQLTDGFKVLETFVQGITLADDVEPESLFSALANLGTSWPEGLPHSNYSLVWPRSTTGIVLPKPVQAVQEAPRVNTAPPAPKTQKSAPAAKKEPSTPDEWRIHLKPYFSMKKKAVELSIPIDGKKGSDVIEEIVTKMFGVTA